jgi:acetoacetate decarboxylase
MIGKFATDANPSGMGNIFGRRPGVPYPADAPQRLYENAVTNMVMYRTKPEVIARVLPPPLEPHPGMPDVVAATLFDAKAFHGFDGRNLPYHEFGMWIPCRYKGYVGMTIIFLYLDGEGADIGLVSGREIHGYPKRLAHIHIYRHGNLTRGTVVREAEPLVTLCTEVKKEIPPETAPLAALELLILVKEIPNCSYSGYDVRKVIGCRFGAMLEISRAWTAEGSIKLGHLESDPADILEVEAPLGAFQFVIQGREGAGGSDSFVIEDLLR